MRWFGLIFCLLTPSWVAAESLQELLDTLNGKVIEIAGEIQNDGMRKPYIMLIGTDSYHQFEYAMGPSELRAVKKPVAHIMRIEPAELRATLTWT